jgi:rRNA maturation RNase YbeY
MIIIKNTQRKIKINTKKIEHHVKQILKILKYENYDVGIWLTTNKTIREYNKNFRKKDKPTDILSFPFYTELKPGERIKPLPKTATKEQIQDSQNLGDIIISPEFAQKDLFTTASNTKDQSASNKNAINNGANFDQHLKILLVHGLCHLIGYDHIKEQDYKIMHKKEMAILEKIKD